MGDRAEISASDLVIEMLIDTFLECSKTNLLKLKLLITVVASEPVQIQESEN